MHKAVLFVTFNRLDNVQKVFEQIQKAKPPRLYIASDGARENIDGEKEKIDEVRNWILSNVNWDCEVKTRFLDKNSGGCAYGVSGAVTWFFQQEEDGIILEDDCVPSQSFFPYCEELLDKYKDDKRVWHITGYGYYNDIRAKETYYFSKIQHCWGWASWADRWKYWKLSLVDTEIDIRKFSKRRDVQKRMKKIYDTLCNKKVHDTWAWPYSFIIVQNNGYCINPYKNLISNIGLSGEHYKNDSADDSLCTKTYELDKIVHPKKVKYNWKAINYIYNYHYKIKNSQIPYKWWERIFSIKNSKNKTHKIVTVLGIKLTLKSAKLLEIINKKYKEELCTLEIENNDLLEFLKHNVQDNSILYIEPNKDAHVEVMPYFIKYFKDRGYNIDIVISPKLDSMKCFERMTGENFNVFLIKDFIRHIFNCEQIKHYKYILFNSMLFEKGDIVTQFPEIKDYINKIYTIEHHLESTNKEFLANKRTICLAKIPNISDNYIVANAHYFGNVEITQKNDLTTFIMVGNLEPIRRNFSLLVDSVKKLAKLNNNFKIIVVGKGKIKTIPRSIRQYFEIKGKTERIPFPNMYELMEKADFFLPMLDPNNPEHDRYITVGTSGSFQLIYGFLKPCLIQKKFADVYNFNNGNSLVYENNDELCNCMLKAIKMRKEDYARMQTELNKLVKNIEDESEKNLDNIFKKECVNA